MASRNIREDVCRGSHFKLFQTMAAIISKYDKVFPESDIIDLTDLSVCDNRGFLKGLPETQTVGNAKLPIEENPLGHRNVSGLYGRHGGEDPWTDLSVTALDLFHEEMMAEVCEHGDFGETTESEDEDISDDTSSIKSGVVDRHSVDDIGENLLKSATTEDEEVYSGGKREGEALKPVQCLEEQLDEVERVEAWLNRNKKRKISVEDESISSPSKISRSEVIKNVFKDCDVKQTWDIVGKAHRNTVKGRNESLPESTDETSLEKRVILSPSRLHNNGSITKGIQFSPNLKTLQSPVRGASQKIKAPVESPSSRMLIESWKSQFNRTEENSHCTGKSEALSEGTCKQASLYRDKQTYMDLSNSPKMSLVRRNRHLECKKLSGTSDTIENRIYLFSHQYLQEVNQNFGKRQAVDDRVDNLSLETARPDRQKSGRTKSISDLAEAQVQNRVHERNMTHKGRPASENTFILAESSREVPCLNDVSSERGRESKNSKRSTPSGGKLPKTEKVMCDFDTRHDNGFSPPAEGMWRRGSSGTISNHSLQTLQRNEGGVLSFVSDPFEFEEDYDLPSSFAPCYNSTMISSVSLVASPEKMVKRSQSENLFTKKAKRKTVKSTGKHVSAKDTKCSVKAEEEASADNPRIDTSPFHVEAADYIISSQCKVFGSTDANKRHSPKSNLSDPPNNQQSIAKICKVPSNKTCGGPNKCKKIFCLKCCHSPLH